MFILIDKIVHRVEKIRMPQESTAIRDDLEDKGTTEKKIEVICAPCPPCKPPDIWSDDRIFLAWQRTHMANERTFLSWARTGIALLAFGFVIERFDIFIRRLMVFGGEELHLTASPHIVYLSLFSFFLAAVATLFSGIRFIAMRRHIDQGEAKFSVIPDILVIVSMIVIIAITIALSVPTLWEWQHFQYK